MAEEQTELLNAQDQLNQYLQHIDEAMASSDVDEMRQHVQDALARAQNALDHLDEALDRAEDPDTADHIETAVNNLGISMDNGDQAMDAPDDEVEDLIFEVRRYALQAAALVGEAMAAAM